MKWTLSTVTVDRLLWQWRVTCSMFCSTRASSWASWDVSMSLKQSTSNDRHSWTDDCNSPLSYTATLIHTDTSSIIRQPSSTVGRLRPPRQTYSNYGDRCFAAAGLKLWNSLPADLIQADISFQRFKQLPNTFLFGCWDCGALWLTVKAAPHKFSYLHMHTRRLAECTDKGQLCVTQ